MKRFVIHTTTCCTPHVEGLRTWYIGTRGKPARIITALLDLSDDRAQTAIQKRKGVRSDISRARRLGYTFEEFAWKSRIRDVVAINHSSAKRQGRRMSISYRRSVEEFGGEDPAATVTEPSCALHWNRTVGVFSTEGTLVAYISLTRSDNIALYGMILGHADHLAAGVMHLMHVGTVDLLQNCGVEAIMYAGWKDGGPGLQSWKRRLGFEPVLLEEA